MKYVLAKRIQFESKDYISSFIINSMAHYSVSENIYVFNKYPKIKHICEALRSYYSSINKFISFEDILLESKSILKKESNDFTILGQIEYTDLFGYVGI